MNACDAYPGLDFKGLGFVSQEREEVYRVRSSENENKNTRRILVGRLWGGKTKSELRETDCEAVNLTKVTLSCTHCPVFLRSLLKLQVGIVEGWCWDPVWLVTWQGSKWIYFVSLAIRLPVMRNIIDWHCMQNHVEEDIEWSPTYSGSAVMTAWWVDRDERATFPPDRRRRGRWLCAAELIDPVVDGAKLMALVEWAPVSNFKLHNELQCEFIIRFTVCCWVLLRFAAR